MMYKSTGGGVVDGTLWKQDTEGWQRSSDGGETWRFSYSPEFYEVTLIPLGDTIPEGEQDREVFGETIDEEIPDDLWSMIDDF